MSIVLVFTICTVGLAKPLSLNEILQATCRVRASNAYGSGTCVKKIDNKYIILTNAHVVGNSNSVTVEFFTGGDKTPPINGSVVWRAYNGRTDVDFALVAVDENAFGSFVPRIIPLVHQGYNIQNNQYITSAGCPAARWAVGWEGHIVQDEHSRLLFTPPPEGGQSGSGIHVLVPDEKGELHTRLGAILTWKIGNGGRNENGYDLSVGGAIPMQTLYGLLNGTHQAKPIPSNYEHVNTVITGNPVNGHFAKDVYGRYHQVYKTSTGQMYVHGENVQIKDWNAVMPTCGGGCSPNSGCPNCGPGFSRNVPNPSPGPNINPFGNRPPDIGAPPPANDGKIDELTNRIKELEAENINLLQELDLIRSKLGIKENDIDDLKKKLEELNNNLDEFNRVKEQLNSAEKEIEHLNGLLAEKTNNLDKNNELLKLLTEDNADKTVEASSKTTQRNLLGVLSGIFGISIIGLIYKLYQAGRPKIQAGMDKVEDKIQEKIGSVVGPDIAQHLRDTLDGFETKIGDLIDKKLSDKIGNQASQPVTQVVYNSIDSKDEEVSVSPYVKQFLALKVRDGEKVEDWALYCLLYKEAIQKLKNEELYFRGDSKLQGQKVTAEKIEAWVINEFFNRTTVKTVSIIKDNRCMNDAMMGFLYKDAVKLLKNGYFNVLGAKETAEAIETWVKKSFLQRNSIVV